MFKRVNFTPIPFLSSPHIQTIFGICRFFVKEPPSYTLHIALEDGDVLAVQVSEPECWTSNGKITILVHGLGGDHTSSALVGIAQKLYEAGHKVYRVNLRGCGTGEGLSKKFYHGGLSEDIRSVVSVVKQAYPASVLRIVGFSMGGNIVLKMAAELGKEGPKMIDRIVAVCPPIDLERSKMTLLRPGNLLYERYFLNKFYDHVKKIDHYFSTQLLDRFLMIETAADFDRHFTVKEWGFSEEKEYYKLCSSKYLIQHICVSCDILVSEDDPVVDFESLKDVETSSSVTVWVSSYGGHMGFLGLPRHKEHGFRWLDGQLMEWVA